MHTCLSIISPGASASSSLTSVMFLSVGAQDLYPGMAPKRSASVASLMWCLAPAGPMQSAHLYIQSYQFVPVVHIDSMPGRLRQPEWITASVTDDVLTYCQVHART
eukprot:jgi/Ulvmu1/689/UM010_0061.1